MRVVMGKQVRHMDRADVFAWSGTYTGMTVDLGAGDGRFVSGLASQRPGCGAIAVDLCEANLRHASRTAPGNALFVVADALELPDELRHVADRVTINFPWGSLLRGLLGGHPGLLAGLNAVARHVASLDIAINGGALAEEGWTMEEGSERIEAVLHESGITIGGTALLGAAELRCWPTTWAKRLAFGRDRRAMRIVATLPGPDHAPRRRPLAALPGVDATVWRRAGALQQHADVHDLTSCT